MKGIYIHIPFCKQKCHYCNFYSLASNRNRESFIGALVREVSLQKEYLDSTIIDSIYLGGGTPSLLSADELNRIFDALNTVFTIKRDAEITLEANPDDISAEAVKTIKRSPVNRFSLGIQSFRDDDLTYLNRVHSAGQAHKSIAMIQDAGFENLTIDLIYGIPTLSEESWAYNLETFFSFNLPHLSAYALTVEPKTALDVLIRKGKLANVDEAKMAGQFDQLVVSMNANRYQHYEISNFALEGQYARHNTGYWQGGTYLGLGPSAHSYDGRSRQWNVPVLYKYIAGIENNKPDFERERLTPEQQYNEFVMVSLRTMWGVHLAQLKEKLGEKYLNHFLVEVQQHIDKENVMLSEGAYKLTRKGKFFADGIASDLFWPSEDG